MTATCWEKLYIETIYISAHTKWECAAKKYTLPQPGVWWFFIYSDKRWTQNSIWYISRRSLYYREDIFVYRWSTGNKMMGKVYQFHSCGSYFGYRYIYILRGVTHHSYRANSRHIFLADISPFLFILSLFRNTSILDEETEIRRTSWNIWIFLVFPSFIIFQIENYKRVLWVAWRILLFWKIS